MPKAIRKTASIKDVAALSGVSVPTVSRYLNTRGRVSEGKRKRIADAIEKLGYRPNPIARALVRERTNTVAILSTDTTLFGASQTIQGIEQEARTSGYMLSISILTNGSTEMVRRSVQSCLDQNPAGIILLNFDSIEGEVFHLLPAELPGVMIAGNREPGIAQVSLCEREGGYAITSHLLALGHRTVTHVAVPGGAGGYSRQAGWRAACDDAGVPTPAPIYADWNPESGRVIGQRLGRDHSVTAIFAGNDELAMGIIRGLNDVHRGVPQDVSVAGFDDHPIARVWNPSLTTIRQDFNGAGRQAFQILKTKIDDLIESKGHTQNWTRFLQIAGELVVRESTGSRPASPVRPA